MTLVFDTQREARLLGPPLVRRTELRRSQERGIVAPRRAGSRLAISRSGAKGVSRLLIS
jgi:hypothetical protein